MQRATPFLWFDNNAEEAMNSYTAIFEDSKVLGVTRYGDAGPGPSGSVMVASFQLAGLEFSALNGGPEYKITPAISFFVSCETERQLDKLWENLVKGGQTLMALDKYQFSEKFGWLVDRFGVSWQLSLAKVKQTIAPFLMFVGAQQGKAEEAIKHYTSIFANSRITEIARYGKDDGEPEGTVKLAKFSLNGQTFMAIDSAFNHQFTFTPAISFYVNCENQQQVDELWDKLLQGGKADQCGWLVDKYGVSWQIVPTVLIEMLQDKDPVKANRVMQAMLKMIKLDIKILRQAYDGN
jgi:predicted 3-demethylubiquinone-9 3-methyltransferase (glyoxalase superfamily)